MQHTTDQHIWDRLRSGDKAALKEIYDSESGYLYNYGRKIFQDITLVEDGIHDLFVDIWNKRATLGPTDSIRRYLATSLRRRVIADMKKQSKSESVESFDQINCNPELAIDQIIIDGEISEEKAQRLKTAFGTLSSRQKEIIYMRFYQNLEYEQIAEITGINYQSLRNTISISMKKLRAEFVLLILIHLMIF
jgi:RNA polymerase sigma factor (sigma-70 family)